MSWQKDIVITGIGVISPIGEGREAFWQALRNGDVGFRKISLFDTSAFKVHIAGEITGFDPLAYIGKKDLRVLDRSTRLLLSASCLAIDDASLEITDENTFRIGVSVGATFGSLHSIAQFDIEGLREGPRYVNPSFFPNTVINSPASQVSIRFKIKGFNSTISTGFCASMDALVYAADFIRLGRADVVLVGGVEELCEETFMGFHNLGLLSGLDGREPLSCPFDRRRNGVILSEGAAVIVIETEEHALDRGAPILARIRSYSSAFTPDGDYKFRSGKGLKTAIENALSEASLAPEDIDYISCCANSTRELDRMESAVIREVFGEAVNHVYASSVKSMIGETYSASGALALAASVGAINKGFIPPTVNYLETDPECDLNHVVNKALDAEIKRALVTSSDPYGNNTVVVIEGVNNE